MMSQREEFRWMMLRIKRMAEPWVGAIRSLAGKQNLGRRRRKKVGTAQLTHLNALEKVTGWHFVLTFPVASATKTRQSSQITAHLLLYVSFPLKFCVLLLVLGSKQAIVLASLNIKCVTSTTPERAFRIDSQSRCQER